jgi:hypothetical protein
MKDAEKRLCISPLRLSKGSEEICKLLGVELGLQRNGKLEGRHLKKRLLCCQTTHSFVQILKKVFLLFLFFCFFFGFL